MLSEPVTQYSDDARAAQQLDLRGVFLPITTPFHASGELDLEGLASNIDKWNTTGIRGYVLLGSTGERVNLDEREYLAVIDRAREKVRGTELAFIVGAGQQSTYGTIGEIRRVVERGPVDAFLIITPHFYRSSITQPALIKHYQAIADASPNPIILYSMPALTGIKIAPETAGRLSEHPNIIGIKDSSADVDGLRETVKCVKDDFAVLTGNGTVLKDAIAAGAIGGILAVGCVAPQTCIDIRDFVLRGIPGAAEELQARLTPLAEAVTVRYGIGGLKAALDMKGYVGGSVRTPLQAPGEDAIPEIRACLDAVESVVALRVG